MNELKNNRANSKRKCLFFSSRSFRYPFVWNSYKSKDKKPSVLVSFSGLIIGGGSVILSIFGIVQDLELQSQLFWFGIYFIGMTFLLSFLLFVIDL
ncbi:hypothetical protein [Campylobacter fetus]|uniref:hypothetical protein n=1 Tax=Campylobacter fetus TaxID=196 RepID=UPI000818AA5C|nr:hypothetical protein [Campylobacter fetus]OCR84645.1 hypothetical protein CFT12S05168_08835 [Campylobacter fetus subsp. testudinum]OCR95649.1 hypothetical protein CFT12S02847_07505 [Campylobacter fetus subsp. testudinum]